MPNYVRNFLTVSGITPERFKQMVNFIRTRERVFDFNNVIPMPEELNIVDSSRNDNFIYLYKHCCNPNAEYSPVLGIGMRTFEEIRMNERMWEYFLKPESIQLTEKDIALLGKTFQLVNDEQEEVPALYFGYRIAMNQFYHHASSWHDWRCEHWGTKWNTLNAAILENGFGWDFDTAWSAPDPIAKALSVIFPSAVFTLEYADEEIGINCGRIAYQDGYEIEFDEFTPGPEAEDFARAIWDIEREV